MSVASRLLLRSRLTLDVQGADRIGEPGPVVIAANYASPADPVLVVAALPRAWRRRLVVCLPSEEGRRPWRPRRSVLVGGATGKSAAAVIDEALDDNRPVLCFPEGRRSRDGFCASFQSDIVAVPARREVAVLPVGLRGSYAAVPDEWRWGQAVRTSTGRPRVSVRFGTAVRAEPWEPSATFAIRLADEVRRLIAEDASSWWATQRHAERDGPGVPTSSWRRIWEQTEAPTAGGRPRRTKIWRS